MNRSLQWGSSILMSENLQHPITTDNLHGIAPPLRTYMVSHHHWELTRHRTTRELTWYRTTIENLHGIAIPLITYMVSHHLWELTWYHTTTENLHGIAPPLRIYMVSHHHWELTWYCTTNKNLHGIPPPVFLIFHFGIVHHHPFFLH
jgi:hypothetical protein